MSSHQASSYIAIAMLALAGVSIIWSALRNDLIGVGLAVIYGLLGATLYVRNHSKW